ncbi:MAG: class I SAM-dependent methyltransferase [Parvularcula sp.]
MDQSPGEFWDERFGGESYAYGHEPTAFVREAAAVFPRQSKILVPGDGEGRHGVFLAGLGFDVTTVDASPLGIAKAKALAEARDVRIKTIEADLTRWDWPEEAFDGVVSVFLHFDPDDRVAVHRAMVKALRPGGILAIEGFTVEQLMRQAEGHRGGPRKPEMLYTEQMLRNDFSDLGLRQIEKVEADFIGDGLHQGQGSTIHALFERIC